MPPVSFEAAGGALKASVAGSMFSRACYLQTQDLLKNFEILEDARRDIRKISSASAFASDATADAVQPNAWAMAATVTVRRNTQLRHWDVNAAALAKVVGILFKGEKLFGEALEPLLVETKGICPSERKPQSLQQDRLSPFVGIDHNPQEPQLLQPHLPLPISMDLDDCGNANPISSLAARQHSSSAPRATSPTRRDASGSLQIRGRLQFFADSWDQTTSDQWAQDTVRLGYALEFRFLPQDGFVQVRRPVCQDKHRTTLKAIQHLVQISAIEPERERGGSGVYSHIFTVSKKFRRHLCLSEVA